MKRAAVSPSIVLLPLPFLVLFGACAGSEESKGAPVVDSGLQDSTLPDTGSPDAAGDADAEALRCSEELCLVDLPNPGAYGFTKWHLRGVQVDPAIGTWAIANGVEGVDEATAQVLRFDGERWNAVDAPALGAGAGRRSIRLASLSADGAGKLLAVGSTIDDGTGAIVRGDGTSFTSEAFEVALEASWFATPSEAWVAGRGGAL